MSAIRAVIAAEDSKVREQETAKARTQIKKLHAQEEAVWKRGGKLLAELAGIWNELVEIIEAEDRFANASGLGGPGAVAVEPAPATFRAFVALLFDVSVDPTGVYRAAPYEQQLTDAGTFGRRDEDGNDIGGSYYDVRPAGVRKIEQRRRIDNHDRLFHLTPDLRASVRALQVSGHIPTIASEG